MSVYTNGVFRPAHTGYLTYATQAAALNAVDAVGAAAAVAGLTTPVGICDFPQMTQNDNVQPAQGISSPQADAEILGRREVNANVRLQVASSAFVAGAFRNKTDPDAAGLVNGLQLFTLEAGSETAYGDGMADQLLDCLFNSLRLEFAENQPLTATADVWGICKVPNDTPQADVDVSALTDLFLWQHLTWMSGGVDYKPILSRGSFGVNNNLERIGSRPQIGARGSENALSRCAYSLKPHKEMLQLQLSLRDELPSSISSNLGPWYFKWTNPNNSTWLQIALDNVYINRAGSTDSNANSLINYTVDFATHNTTAIVTAG